MGEQPSPKVLMVDDRPENLYALEKTLQRLPVELFQTTSGNEALGLTLEHEFALAIVDVQMPEMDGYELVELLRGNPKTSTMPVIFISAIYSDNYHHLKGYEAGAVDFLSKPFDPEILLGKVRIFLELYQQRYHLQSLVEQLNSKNKQLKAEITQRETVEQSLRETNERLVDAKAKAEIANQAKTEFLSKMSHEFRTPLNGILGYIQIMQQDKSLPQSYVDKVDVIRQSGEHLLTLIMDLLDIAKIEAHKMELQLGQFNLPDLLHGVIGMVSFQAQQKGLTFQHNISTNLPTHVVADGRRLRQILLNLLGNAIKFTHTGQVTLEITLVKPTSPSALNHETLLPTQAIQFAVKDTGVGMSAEHLHKIFMPFEQVGDLQSRAEGTGLGLAISYQLVKLMGGSLTVDSVVGEGSCFKFTLALPLADLSDQDKQVIQGYEGPTLKALIVDDKEQNAVMLKTVLEKIGFEILVANNGQMAISLTESFEPHIILMDLMMPIKTGFEAIKTIRQDSSFDDIVIIAVSASVLDMDITKSRLMGCQGFLPKPINLQHLYGVLAQTLQLNWVYDTVDESVTIETSNWDIDALLPPPLESLEALYELAKRGNMKKVRKWAQQLNNHDRQYQSFTQYVEILARNYDGRAIVTLAEKYLPSSSTSTG